MPDRKQGRWKTSRMVLLGAALALTGGALAQQFPTRPIRMIVPYGAGGGPDVTSRLVGKSMQDKLGQSVVIENRPGSAGVLASELGARAAPDGYTILCSDSGTMAINRAMYEKLPYDPLKDFAPVSLGYLTALYVVVNASVPVKSMREFIDYAKSHPGTNFGSIGNGSPHHLGMEMFRLMTGANMVHIPYKGVAQAVPALISGEIPVVIAGLSTVLPHLNSGKIRVLATTQKVRAPALPDVPTVAESGLPDYEVRPSAGYLVPAGTPRALIDRLNASIREALVSSEVIDTYAKQGLHPQWSTPEQYGERMRAEIEMYGRLVRESGMKID